MTVPFWVVLIAGVLFVGLVAFGIWFRARVITARALYTQAILDYRDCPDELEDPAS